MKTNDIATTYPPLYRRMINVWLRHYKVYKQNVLPNVFPAFLEPLIFLSAVGLGLGRYVETMEGMPYIMFLSTGLVMTSAMFTAAFDCSYGTYFRLNMQNTYGGMMASPLKASDIIIGEIFWAGTKGMFFSAAVLSIVSAFRVMPYPASLIVPFCGFINAVMFACVSLITASYVKNLNQFNFYITGFLSPMFFLGGVVFSIDQMPHALQIFTEFLPLTHPVRIIRAVCTGEYPLRMLWDIAYCFIFIYLVGGFAVKRMKSKIIY